MNYRETKILAEKSLAAAGTETIDIKVKDIISRISIRFELTKSKNAMDAHPAGNITKIELVDGSDVLHSLTGYENQALCIYDRKCPTMIEGDYYNGLAMVSHYGIDFGRKLWDTDLAFDPTKFTSPQLKITYTLTTADSGASAAALEVIGWVFDQKVISPIGFFMSKEHYSYTCGADGSYQYIDLPTDYPTRKMLVRGYYAGYDPWYSIEKLRLDEDNLKRIPLDLVLEDYYREMMSIWTPVNERFHTSFDPGTTTRYVTPTDYAEVFGDISGAVQTGYHSGYVRGGKISWVQASPAQEFHGRVVGWLPNHCFEFPFGLQDEIADWYDVTKLGTLTLRLEAGSAGSSGTGQVILQQLRGY